MSKGAEFYKVSFAKQVDKISVESSSEWTTISVHHPNGSGDVLGTIVLKSFDEVADLYYMLGRLIGEVPRP